jgi:carbonic anhydrase/acetyltransferase-like protein (isoleucine patch superfamily)
MNGRQVLALAVKACKRRPAPKAFVAIYLSLRWRSYVSLTADITYPFSLRLGRGVRIGQCRIRCKGRIELGDQVCVHDNAILDAKGGEIVLGNRVLVNSYCVLSGVGGLKIGQDTAIAFHTVIVAFNHGIDNLDVPIMYQPLQKIGISIGENTWIGANCVILDGVTIGTGAVIAAGSVVSRDVASEDVVGGVPARVIKNRRQEVARKTDEISPKGPQN